MQLLEILEGLTTAEQRKIEAQLKKVSRKEPYLLFKELRKSLNNKKGFNSEASFKLVFGKEYSAKTKYLLANELRYLKTQVYDFMVEEALAEERKRNKGFYNKWLMQSLHDRGLNGIFEKDIEKYIADAKVAGNFEDELALTELRTHHYVGMSITSPLSNDERIEALNDLQQLLTQNLAHAIKDIEVSKAYNVRINYLLRNNVPDNKEPIPFELTEQIDLHDFEDNRTRLLYLMVQANVGAKGERHSIYLKMVELINKLGSNMGLKPNTEMVLYGKLSQSYATEREFDTALEMLDTQKQFAQQHNLVFPEICHARYILYSVHTGDYQAGIQYFHDHESILKQGRYFYFAIAYLTFAYLHTRQTDKAIKLVTEYLMDVDEHQFPNGDSHRRVIYMIAALVDKDFETAERECTNYLRSSTYTEKATHFRITVGKFYHQYIKAHLKLPGERQQKLIQLYDEILVFRPEVTPALTLEWLKKQVQIEIRRP